MDLSHRLVLLRRQGGTAPATPVPPASPATASAEGRQCNGAPFPATAWAEGGQFNGPPSPTPDSVAARLQRLGGVPSGATARSSRDEHVASLLQGERLAEGLVVIDHHMPLSHQHGKRALAPITALHHPRPLMGQALPAEQLVFLDTETTGLSGGTGTLAILVGLGRIDGEVLRLR